MKELSELVQEATLFFKIGRRYFEMQLSKEEPGVVKNFLAGTLPGQIVWAGKPAAEKVPDAQPPAKKKDARAEPKQGPGAKTIEGVLGKELESTATATAGEPGMSEKESLDMAYKLATRYIAGSEASTAEEKDVRKAGLIAWNKDKFKGKASISSLSHPQRMEFIAYVQKLDAEMAAGAL